MATWLQSLGNLNNSLTDKFMAGGIGKGLSSLGVTSGGIGGIANTIGQLGTGLLAGQNQTGVGNALQTIGGLASNIPGVGGLIGAGVGVVGGLVNAAFGSHINEEFVNQTQNQANTFGSRIFNSNTNSDLLNDWQSMVTQSNVSKSEVGSDGWFSNKASRETARLNERINEANRRQLANFGIAAVNVDAQNDLRILQNMAAYGGPINSFRKYYADGGLLNTPQFFTFEPQTYDKGGYLNQAKALIRQNEGWRDKPYADAPKGKQWRSVGYGFNDSGFREKYPEGISKHYEHGITKKQAEEELDYFLNKAEKQLKSIYGKQWNDFTDSQKAAILDTYYQRPASVGKSSRFYKAVTAGEDAGRYLGVAGFSKRNKIRQGVFGGGYSDYGDWTMTETPEPNPSSLQEVTPIPVVQGVDLEGITPTEAKALELNLTSPTYDLSMFGKAMSTPQESQVPTVGTVEDFLASYGDFEQNLFKNGGNLFEDGGYKTTGGAGYTFTLNSDFINRAVSGVKKGINKALVDLGIKDKKRTLVKTIKLKNGILTGEVDDQGNMYWFRNGEYITPDKLGTYKYYDPRIKGYRTLNAHANSTNDDKQNVTYNDVSTPVYTPSLDELNNRVKERFKKMKDDQQNIPVDGQNMVTLRTKGKMNLADVPENMLDSIAVNAGRSGTDFWTDAALIGKESTFGEHSAALRNPWTLSEEALPYFLTSNHAYFKTPEEDYIGALSKKYDFTDDYQTARAEEAAKYAIEHNQIVERTPHYSEYILADAFKRYQEAPTKYNPNQKNYVPMLNEIKAELQGERQLQHYWNTKGKAEYARGQQEGMAFGGELNIKDMNIFDFGGGLTHGADWDTGINWIGAGGSHGENPLGGVQMGVDEQGIPNLVEEGEAIWNGDYVFSKRMKVPKKLAKKYGLGGDMTFADAIAKLTKDSEERPLSNIDRATNDHILGEFADSQEELRMAKAQRAMDKEIQLQDDFLTGFQFGLGGHMSPLGIVPDADNISPFEKAEKLFADGGGIHIDPSKKGTFKAQASKMGMGVQEAASHILANKEDYSPAMVRKANFARNASHWHGDGGDLFSNPFAYGGELGNVFAGEGNRPNTLNLDVANQSLVRRIFGDTGFTRFMENTSAALNDPLGYFAGDEINAVIDKLGKMSEPQLERFFRTDIGRAIAPYLVGDDNSQVQESGMRGAKSVANIVRRVQRPVQIAAKKAMAQSRQAARGQMRTPKGGGSQKVLNETMTPTQTARQATTGSTEGLPQGWNFTRGNTSTVTNTSGVTGRLNPKSPTGRAAQSRGTAPDPFAGLEGTLNMRAPIGSGNFGYLPWALGAAGVGGAGYGLYKGLDWLADNLTNPDGTINGVNDPATQATINSLPSEATSNRGNGNKGKAAVTETPAITPEETGAASTRRGAQGSGRGIGNGSGTATRNRGSVVPFAYDWYRNGSDGIGTPTGFKVGKNGKAYDYTPEYKALVASLGADDIRKWAAEHPNDPSLKSFLAKGNKLEDLKDDQWRKGATDGKYGFMHHVAEQKLQESTRGLDMPEGNIRWTPDPTVIENPQISKLPTSTTTSGTGQNGAFSPKQTWTRNLPWMMSGIMGLKEMLTPADYGNADMILDAAYRVGQPISVGTEYIGDYRRRDPFDERYLMNIINQNRAAANRNMMNFSGGNRAIGMAGILTNDLTSQMSLAEAARQAYLANRADDADVATFNKDTNKYNATAQNTRNLSLAQLNSGRQSAMLSGIAQGARLRQAIKDQRDAAISANLTNFAQGLGDLGKENGYYNMLGGLNEEGILKYFYGDDWKTKFNNVNV